MKLWNYQTPNLIPRLTPQGRNKSLVWMALGRSLAKNHDNSRNLQAEWATKLPWAKGLVVAGGIIQIVRCKICSLIENKEKIVKCKWDTLTKHDGCRIVVRDLPQWG